MKNEPLLILRDEMFRDIKFAPKDGTVILARCIEFSRQGRLYNLTPIYWDEEWVGGEFDIDTHEYINTKGRWTEWCGNYSIKSTASPKPVSFILIDKQLFGLC